jgi:hypothetical protein
LIDEVVNLIDVGLVDEAFHDSKLLVCNYLLVDGFPNLLESLVTLFAYVDSFEIELNQFR